MVCQFCYGQQNIHIDKVNGDVVKGNKIVNKITVYNKITDSNKDKVLLVNKYIDIKKHIFINAGSNVIGTDAIVLEKKGLFPLLNSDIDPSIKRLLKIRIENGKLLIDADINDFDEKYILRIRDNKLIEPTRYTEYITDRYIEIFDNQYFIPVLQIELDKKNNTIYIGGVFNFPGGYIVMNKDDTWLGLANKDKFHMTADEKQRAFGEYLEDVRKRTKPLHY